MQQCVYETKICNIYDLQKCLTQTWVDSEQNVIEAAIDQWHAVKLLFVTFRVSGRRREMYCGHNCVSIVLWSRASVCVLSVWLSVCLSVCPRPHAYTIARSRM